jgi:5-methylcytosine-specific restriction enzyme B
MPLRDLSELIQDVKTSAKKLTEVSRSRKLSLKIKSKTDLLVFFDELEETQNGFFFTSSPERKASCGYIQIAHAAIASKLARELKKYRDAVYKLLDHLGKSDKKKSKDFFDSVEEEGSLDQVSIDHLANNWSENECKHIIKFLCKPESWGKGKGLERLQDYRNSPVLGTLGLTAESSGMVASMACKMADDEKTYEFAEGIVEEFLDESLLLQEFKKVCLSCSSYDQSDEPWKTNGSEAKEAQLSLDQISQMFHEDFEAYRGISFEVRQSKGRGNYPKVPWVCILPPGQTPTDGVYYSVCFGREGNGAVAGFSESVGNRKGLSIDNLREWEELHIDVDGGDPKAFYSGAFNNPKLFMRETFDVEEFRQHIIESLDLCIKFLGLEPGDESRPYSLDDVLADLFIEETKIQSIKDSLETKKNVVLQGPPGVGKTFVAQRLAYYLIGQEKESNVVMVQFHQSYSYEDFIQGYRPNEEHFELKDGVFYRFCEKARESPDEKFVFIIDEINRGNLSKIFGEVMMLIEADKREQKYAVDLTYAKEKETPFYIPENVHLLGLMNTADRSLAIVDYALRRRFRFFNIEPSFGDAFKKHLTSNGVSSVLVDEIAQKIEALNGFISKDHRNLGEGFMIGHSYFCDPPSAPQDQRKWLNEVFEYEIAPLINEYWIDDKDEKEKQVESLLKVAD